MTMSIVSYYVLFYNFFFIILQLSDNIKIPYRVNPFLCFIYLANALVFYVFVIWLWMIQIGISFFTNCIELKIEKYEKLTNLHDFFMI